MRRLTPTLLVAAALLGGCSSVYGGYPLPGGPAGDVVVVSDRDRGGDQGARRLGVPPGHYPPPGECRIWYPGTPPGQQPPPARCERLIGRVPFGAFILYNGREWDTRYDWEARERRSRGSVPDVILSLMRGITQ